MTLPKNERRAVGSGYTHKKMWLYGLPFSGKTYLANKFPNVLMLNTDGNIKFVDAPYVPIKDVVTVDGRVTKRTLAWQVFKDSIAELEKMDNDYETIVVDILEDMYEYCRLFMYNKMGISHESDDGFKAWDMVRVEFLSTMKKLLNLNYNIVLLSHEDSSKDITAKSGSKVTSIKPNIQDKVALKVAGMVDIVGRVINDEGKRIISFKTNEVIFGGGRLNVGSSEIDCTYEGLMGIYGEDGKPVETKPVKAPVETKPAEVETSDAPPTEAETPADSPAPRTRRRRV